ncbi:MAG: GIY-YIG nuclease family protein [Candidatus Omnitrophota bacterium]
MKYFVYILRSLKDGRFYTGMTRDLPTRMERHNGGREPSTKSRRPFVLVVSEEIEGREEARIREKYWKSGAGREKLKRAMAEADLPLGKSVIRNVKADLPAGRRARWIQDPVGETS